jgi:hypothetical protein
VLDTLLEIVVSQLEKPSPSISPAFFIKCCKTLSVVYKCSTTKVQASSLSKIYTLLAKCTKPKIVSSEFSKYYKTLSSAVDEEHITRACDDAMSALTTIIHIGLPKLTPSNDIEEVTVLSTWETILEELRTIGNNDQSSTHSVELLNIVVDCALPLLHDKQVPRSVQESLVSILDRGCTLETSPLLRQACTKQLFMLCGETPPSASTTTTLPTVASVRRSSGDHIAAAVAPVVLERCKQSLLEFVAASSEAPVTKDCTKNESETSEHGKVLQVLEQLQVLNMHPDAFSGKQGHDKSHLIELYPVLCNCISALGSTEEEKAVSKALSSLFQMVGEKALK